MLPHKATRLLLLLLLLCTTLAMGATITLFQAVFDSNNVRVTWEVASESGVQSYELYRKTNADPGFNRLTTLAPTGQGRYQYLDTDVYRGAQGGGPFIYRLNVRTTTGDQQYTSTLGQTPSAVQRSWGSIKSMFR
jgi:hypothetical protein